MEYSQLINRLLDAEQGAQDLVKEAREREAAMEAELAGETAKLRSSTMEKAQGQVKAMTAQALAHKEEALASQDAQRNEAIGRMEQAYERYGDNWVDTLFHRIVDQHS